MARVQVTLEIELPAYELRGHYVPDVNTPNENYIKYLVLDILNAEDFDKPSSKVKEYLELEVESDE